MSGIQLPYRKIIIYSEAKESIHFCNALIFYFQCTCLTLCIVYFYQRFSLCSAVHLANETLGFSIIILACGFYTFGTRIVLENSNLLFSQHFNSGLFLCTNHKVCVSFSWLQGLQWQTEFAPLRCCSMITHISCYLVIFPKAFSRDSSAFHYSENKGKRKAQGVPQSQTAALPRHQEEEEIDQTKQAQIEQTYEKH